LEIINLIIVAILIALTGFFVASEFAIVKIRSTRIDQLITEGHKNAVPARKVVSNLDEYLSASQLGITVTALGLGWIGEPTIEKLLHPFFDQFQLTSSIHHLLSFIVAFLAITFLHVVLGELAPKTWAIQEAEAVTLLFSRPLILFYKIMYPFIWVLNGSARFITRLLGLQPASEHDLTHSEEELRIILSESYESGEINQSEFKYVNNIFEFNERIAKEIMVPRTEIVTVSKDETIESFLNIAGVEKYTRYPVILDSDKDQIVGLINIKEILTDFIDGKDIKPLAIEYYAKPIIRVIESIPIHDLLLKMQKDRIHMAVLIDEYGGTAGLVTAEDILEEIVGDIRDEFDADELPYTQKIKDDHYRLDSKLLIDEVNHLLGTNIEEEDMDTIGGWILTQCFDVQEGDSVTFDDYTFKIIDMDGRHIKRLEVFKTTSQPKIQPLTF
jgi:CBS domain containing-hemolysin-like protein